MQIPFFDIKRQYTKIADEVEQNVLSVMQEAQYIEGNKVKELEERLADYLGVKYVITCGNGTDALRIALKACNIMQGDEVITTAFTFFATAEAIAQVGAVPVFADIREDTLNLDPESIKEKITSRTKAILPVHIFGMPAEMDRINDIARKYHLAVIEDACQAIGAEYKGKKAGTMGTIGCFSFYPTKNLGAFGDGGAIVTDDIQIAEACRAYKTHGSGKAGAKTYRKIHHLEEKILSQENTVAQGFYDPYKYYNYLIGDNSRLDTIQAAILCVKLKRLDEFNKRRKEIAEQYMENLKDLPIKIVQKEGSGYCSCYHQYVVLCEDKKALVEYLQENGIGTGAFYPIPLHLQKAFAYLNYSEGDLPVTEKVCRQSVCLPIFPELEDREIAYIIEKIIKYYEDSFGIQYR